MALLSESEIQGRLAQLAGWRVVDASLEREWQLSDFAAALAFVNRVGELAEQINHHPDILIHGWNKVRLTLSTHTQGGLTSSDFDLAARIDELG